MRFLHGAVTPTVVFFKLYINQTLSLNPIISNNQSPPSAVLHPGAHGQGYDYTTLIWLSIINVVGLIGGGQKESINQSSSVFFSNFFHFAHSQ